MFSTQINLRNEIAKHHFLKSVKMNTKSYFRRECSSPFQGTAASKVQLTTALGQLYRSYKVSPTLYQTDLRITNHRGPKISPSRTLLSFKTRIDWPLVLTLIARFSRAFFNSRNALMTKTDLTFQHFFLRFVDFAIQFLSRCKILFQE